MFQSVKSNNFMWRPSSLCPHFSDDRKEASRPKKTFRAADVRRMHDILSKNMYKIRQKVTCTQMSVIPKRFDWTFYFILITGEILSEKVNKMQTLNVSTFFADDGLHQQIQSARQQPSQGDSDSPPREHQTQRARRKLPRAGSFLEISSMCFPCGRSHT